jgi:hypothetical protein
VTCTCGEPPFSGHYLWCARLYGQRDYRAARSGTITVEELEAVLRGSSPDRADVIRRAIVGDADARKIVCDELNRSAALVRP